MPVVQAGREVLREPARGRVHHVLGLRLVGVEDVVDVVGSRDDVQRLVVGAAAARGRRRCPAAGSTVNRLEPGQRERPRPEAEVDRLLPVVLGIGRIVVPPRQTLGVKREGTTCSDCGYEYRVGERGPCPKCGGTAKTVHATGAVALAAVGSATVSVTRQAVDLVARGEPGLTIAEDDPDPRATLLLWARRTPEQRRRITENAVVVLAALLGEIGFLLRSHSVSAVYHALELAVAVAILLNALDDGDNR